ncbi:hypothetical protein AVEN_7961-1 [Araneus ventricosus]|uniref:Uncharacterized protein n=1 Tax=Araneus ventricosus TaxID=182803 RepID=A0A4Y2D564_ARAVE|nr:hypothetical protein AVEN_7961-1 [Araneus ventricosus]
MDHSTIYNSQSHRFKASRGKMRQKTADIPRNTTLTFSSTCLEERCKNRFSKGFIRRLLGKRHTKVETKKKEKGIYRSENTLDKMANYSRSRGPSAIKLHFMNRNKESLNMGHEI